MNNALLAIKNIANTSNLHVHDVGVGLHHAVAHMEGGLEADLGLLYGHHGFFQADLRVFQLHFPLQAAGFVLGSADCAKRAFEFAGEAATARLRRCLAPPGLIPVEGRMEVGIDTGVSLRSMVVSL